MATEKKLDLASLAPSVAELPKRASTRTARDNPFVPWVGESFEDGKGRQVVVPKGTEKEAVYLIRQAAKTLGIGVRVVIDPDPGTEQRPASDEVRDRYAKARHITVKFQGKEKRKASEPADETPSEGAA